DAWMGKASRRLSLAQEALPVFALRQGRVRGKRYALDGGKAGNRRGEGSVHDPPRSPTPFFEDFLPPQSCCVLWRSSHRPKSENMPNKQGLSWSFPVTKVTTSTGQVPKLMEAMLIFTPMPAVVLQERRARLGVQQICRRRYRPYS